MVPLALVGVALWTVGAALVIQGLRATKRTAAGFYTSSISAKGTGMGQNPPASASEVPPVDTWVKLVIDGKDYLVCPVYIAPIRIGEAVQMAKDNGWTLPTPRMVDAIWQAADLKVEPIPMAHDGTARTMNSQELAERHRRRISDQLLGKEFGLLAGTHKDVVFISQAFGKPVNRPGIYGWHRRDGSKIQQEMWGHSLDWGDYSQGLRPVLEV